MWKQFNKIGHPKFFAELASVAASEGGKSGRTVKGIYGWWSDVKWRVLQWRRVNRVVPWRVFTDGEVKGIAVKEGKSGRTVKGIYGWWSEVKWRVLQWRRVNRVIPWRVFTDGEVKWREVKGIRVKEGKSGRTVKGI